MVGSPFWIPPEMIRKERHGIEVDLWSLGICILEVFLSIFPYFPYFHFYFNYNYYRHIILFSLPSSSSRWPTESPPTENHPFEPCSAWELELLLS